MKNKRKDVMKISAMIVLMFVVVTVYGQSLPYNKFGTVGVTWVADTVRVGQTFAPTTARVNYQFWHDGAAAATDTLFLRFVLPTTDSTKTSNRVIMLLGGQTVTFTDVVSRVWYRLGSDSSVPYKMVARVQ